MKILEDRLLELERKLDQHPASSPQPSISVNVNTSGSGSGSTPHDHRADGVDMVDSVDTSILETPSYHYGVPHINSTFHLPEYEVDNMAMNPESEIIETKSQGQAHKTEHEHEHEPDLMTLADAATGRDWPWEGMSPDVIVKELVAAVDGQGGKGPGDKILSHLYVPP